MNSGKNPSLVEARKLMTREEIKAKVSPFDCKKWLLKKAEIRIRVARELEEVKRLRDQ